MANNPIRNPFGPLEVRSDDEDEYDNENYKNTTSSQVFILKGPTIAIKRKKKIRPEEKKRLEEEKLKKLKKEKEEKKTEKTEKIYIIEKTENHKEFEKLPEEEYYEKSNNDYNQDYYYDSNYNYYNNYYSNSRGYKTYNRRNYYQKNQISNQDYLVQEKELVEDKPNKVDEDTKGNFGYILTNL